MRHPLPSLTLTLALSLAAAAQTPAGGWTLPQAVSTALAHYPAVIAAQHQTELSQAALQRQRAALLPELQLAAQFDRASDNNTPGLLIGNGLPTISGPVASHYSWAGFTTSSAGAVRGSLETP